VCPPPRPTSLLLHAQRSGRKASSSVEQEQHPTGPLVPLPPRVRLWAVVRPLSRAGRLKVVTFRTSIQPGVRVNYLPSHRKHVMSLGPSVILRPVRTAVPTLGLGQAPLWVWTISERSVDPSPDSPVAPPVRGLSIVDPGRRGAVWLHPPQPSQDSVLRNTGSTVHNRASDREGDRDGSRARVSAPSPWRSRIQDPELYDRIPSGMAACANSVRYPKVCGKERRSEQGTCSSRLPATRVSLHYMLEPRT